SDVHLAFFMVHEDVPWMQLLGIFGLSDLDANDGAQVGLHHVQFRVESLDALIEHYERFHELGFTPHRAANHGMSTSFYYRDPDANIVEVSCANFPPSEAHQAFIAPEQSARN